MDAAWNPKPHTAEESFRLNSVEQAQAFCFAGSYRQAADPNWTEWNQSLSGTAPAAWKGDLCRHP
jgi:hypothetical protein